MKCLFICCTAMLGMLQLSAAFSEGSEHSTDVAATAQSAQAYVAQNSQDILSELVDYLSIPNHSEDLEDISRNIAFLEDALRSRGAQVRLLESNEGNPALYADIRVENAGCTLVIYSHMDGQPVQRSRWDTPPFEPTLKKAPFTGPKSRIELRANGEYDPNWRLFARSAADDKSPLIAVLASLDALRDMGRSPICHLKFFVEAEEEAGSPHLAQLLRRHKSLYEDADAWIFADGPMHESGKSQIVFGVRGVVGAKLTVYGADRPLHSGHYGNFAPNAAARLAYLITRLRGEQGEILIGGFNDRQVRIPEEAISLLRKNLGDRHDTLTRIGLVESERPGLFRDEAVLSSALNILRVSSAQPGERLRNVVPARASAEIEFRLAPGISPEVAMRLLIDHLRAEGFHVVNREPDLAVRQSHERIVRIEPTAGGYAAAYTDARSTFALSLTEIVDSVADAPVIVPLAGGSLPLFHFQGQFNRPFAILPITNPDSNQHAPNENIRLGDFFDGIVLYAAVLGHFHPR